MAVDKPHITNPGLYFITFTNYKWIPLLQITNAFDLVYKWFDYLKNNGHYINGYVIMPNHLHALIGFAPNSASINKIVGNGKRFMAYGIVDRLKAAGNESLLKQLAEGVTKKDRSKGKLHEVFEPSFDIKDCYNLPFINQKLEYIHANPVSSKWNLAEDELSYTHSSAKFYQTGIQGIYEVTNFIDLFDRDWHNTSS